MLTRKRTRWVAFAVVLTFFACSEVVTEVDESVDMPLFRSSSAPTLNSLPPFPFWARGPLCCFDGYAAVYFYVADPVVIPDDFNFLGFFDPRALGAPAWAVEGFGIFDQPGLPPRKSHLSGLGAVPFWFVTEAQFQAAAADNVITKPELESFNPIKGFADRFEEELHPTGSSVRQAKLLATAGGNLIGGGTFRFGVQIHGNLNTGTTSINIKGSLDVN